MKKLNNSTWILIAMVLGIAAGAVLGEKGVMFGPIGDIFIGLIKMLVIPLVFFSIISGAAALGKTKSAGKVGFLTIFYYLGTSAISVVLGLIAGNIFKPGLGVTVPQSLLTDSSTYAEAGNIAGFWDTILGIIPKNPFESLVSGNILQILFFALFFGICLSALDSKKQRPVLEMLDSVNDVLILMITKVLVIAPLGVFALMVNSIALFGIDVLLLVLKLFLVFTGTLATIHFIMIPALVKAFTGINPITFIKKLAPAQLLAFSTASSMATLPITKQCCEEIGVSKSTTSFVLPLGATVNMNGNAMLYALTTVFFAQMYGIELGATQYAAIILTSVLGAIGTAGVPGPALLVVAVLLAAGVPVTALPLIFGADRLFDMMRTSTNIFGDASCAVIIERVINGREAFKSEKSEVKTA